MYGPIIRSSLSLWLCTVALVIPVRAARPTDSCFMNLPAGCSVNRSEELPGDQVAVIGGKLGAAVKRISNTYLTVQGQSIQVNIIEGKTETDAFALYKAISGTKHNLAFCLRKGNCVVEFVARDTAHAIKTSYELGFVPKPKHVLYRVTAKLATLDKTDYMACNAILSSLINRPLILSGYG